MGSLAVKFLSALFAFFNGIMLARLLGLEDFGLYVLAFTTVTVITVPASIGFPELITRYISKYRVVNNQAATKGLLIKTNLYVLYVLLALGILTAVLWFFLREIYSPEIINTFLYAMLLLPLLVYGSLRSAALRGLKLVLLGQLPDTFIRNFLLSMFLAYYFFSKHELGPSHAMLLHVVAAVAAFLIGSLLLERKLLRKLRGLTPEYHTREWMRQALPFATTQGVTILKNRSLPYILAVFGGVETVALFDVAMRGATLVSFTLSAINSGISPFISDAFEKNRQQDLQRIVTKATRITFLFALPVALIFIIGGERLIDFIFGKEYLLAAIPMIILCVGQLINAMTGSVGVVLNMTGHQSYLSKNQILMMVLSIISAIPLVIYYDVIGAAISFSVVLIVQNIILVRYIRNKVGIYTSIF